YFAAAEGFENVRFCEQRVVPHGVDGDFAIGELGRVAGSGDRRSAHVDGLDADGFGAEPKVDRELPLPRHKRVQGMLGIADETDGDLVLPWRDLSQPIAPALVGSGCTVVQI